MLKVQQTMLSNKSSSAEIKDYFFKVLELSKLNEKFPVNLDCVWALAYKRKEEAVRALKENFIHSIDYQVLRKNAENLKAGRPPSTYYLSISCLEYFIARKVRPIFEVYRRVFHKIARETTESVYLFHYLNNPIRFKVDGCVMINATNMAKPFKKLPAGWLRLNSTKHFIKQFSVMRNHITADLVVVKNGGNPQLQGTWMHEDIALEFARWLSPEFAIWCNDRIKEILQKGGKPEELRRINAFLTEELDYWKKSAERWADLAVKECETTARTCRELAEAERRMK